MNPNTAREESPLTKHDYVEDVKLWLKFSTDSDFTVTLTIPTEEFSQFTFRPLSWLRFLGSAIYGRKGVLILSPEGIEVDDYAVGIEILEASYYYSSTGKPRNWNPTHHFAYRRTSTSGCSRAGRPKIRCLQRSSLRVSRGICPSYRGKRRDVRHKAERYLCDALNSTIQGGWGASASQFLLPELI